MATPNTNATKTRVPNRSVDLETIAIGSQLWAVNHSDMCRHLCAHNYQVSVISQRIRDPAITLSEYRHKRRLLLDDAVGYPSIWCRLSSDERLVFNCCCVVCAPFCCRIVLRAHRMRSEASFMWKCSTTHPPAKRRLATSAVKF